MIHRRRASIIWSSKSWRGSPAGVTTATSGSAALEIVVTDRPDVLVADLGDADHGRIRVG
jgi:hypothetical protein